FDDSAIYITSNMFNGPTVDMAVIPKAQLVQASPPSSPTFVQLVNITTANNTTAFTIQPCHMFGSGTAFLASVPSGGSTRFYVYRLNNPTATPTLSKATVTVASTSSPPDAAQPGSTNLIATNDKRLLTAVWRNNRLWATHAVANGTVSAARWYE